MVVAHQDLVRFSSSTELLCTPIFKQLQLGLCKGWFNLLLVVIEVHRISQSSGWPL